jgi:hypothetical protein
MPFMFAIFANKGFRFLKFIKTYLFVMPKKNFLLRLQIFDVYFLLRS